MKYLKLNVLFTILFLTYSISYSQSWVQQYSSTTASIYDLSFLNINTGYAGCTSGIMLKTTNSGMNWTRMLNGYTFNIIKIKFFDPNFGVAGGEKLLKTTNGGLNWNLVRDTIYANDVHFLNQNEWWICSSSPHSNLKTTDQGVSWQSIGETDLIQPSIFFVDQNTGWISGKFITGSFIPTHISKTTNSGSQWGTQFSQISQQNNGWIYDILFTDLNKGYALYWDFSQTKILKTTNGGLNWQGTATPMRKLKNLFFIDEFTGWACGDSGYVYKTMNSGLTWMIEQISPALNLNAIYFVNNETGWVCAAGGIIYKTTNGGITAIQQTGNEIPITFSLSQNYPNPFNPATQISFEIPKTSIVNLTLYDATGRVIAQLVNQQLSPGSYKVDWDASNYPSGVYYYRLQAGEYTETKKMVLIK